MTEGRSTDERPSADLVSIVLDHFGVSLSDAAEAWEGEESIGWRGSSADGDRFVQRLPSWRDIGELEWSDSVARAASTAAPESVHAIRSQEGTAAVITPEGAVMVYPFVAGTHESYDGLESDAADLLARIHRGIAASWMAAEPPLGRPRPRPRVGREDLLVDEALDHWQRRVSGGSALPIHGDYYGGNLLIAEAGIAGVIDWFDAEIAPHEQEVAWAVWEFCHNAREDLLDDEAEAFLRRYLEAGGTAAVGKPFDPCPWIRIRLRAEARMWFADPRSKIETSEYHEAQLVAFERLRGRRLPGRWE